MNESYLLKKVGSVFFIDPRIKSEDDNNLTCVRDCRGSEAVA